MLCHNVSWEVLIKCCCDGESFLRLATLSASLNSIMPTGRSVVSSFTPQGVCATQIDFEIDDEGLTHNIHFTKGCPGNAVGVAKLAEGRPATEIIELFTGLPCGHKSTSCPAQLAQALSHELETRPTDPNK
jgi:uncharacterized protein (TIGR03905 family)